jgi:hypothetical protein
MNLRMIPPRNNGTTTSRVEAVRLALLCYPDRFT